MNLDKVLCKSLERFALELKQKWTYVKEREAVSIFAFDYFLEDLRKSGLIQRNSQLAIESRVPQLNLNNEKKKKAVCKDLVIWKKPFQNCWRSVTDATLYPLAVIEWKADSKKYCAKNANWLTEYTIHTPTKLGYCITLDWKERNFLINVVRIKAGKKIELLTLNSTYLQKNRRVI